MTHYFVRKEWDRVDIRVGRRHGYVCGSILGASDASLFRALDFARSLNGEPSAAVLLAREPHVLHLIDRGGVR